MVLNRSNFEPIKIEELKENIKIGDTRNMITKTEDGLRGIIDSILTRKHGVNWENDSHIGWSKRKKQELENRLKNKQSKFPEHTHSTRLLDHGYIYDLKYLIGKNESVFISELGSVKKVTTYLEILGENRNTLMHSDDVDEYQKHLCLGICGYLQQVVEKWKMGYKRKAKRWEADIRLSQPESMGEDTAKKGAQRLADVMIQKLKLKSTSLVTEKNDNNQAVYEIPINKGKLLIRISKPTRQNHSERGIFQSVNVHLSSESFELISKTLAELPNKNWTFTWIIPEGLDAIFTIDKIQQIRRIRTSGSMSYSGTELIGRRMNFYLQNNEERVIRADIGGGKNHPTKITLVFDGAGPNGGFTNAHDIFSPDEILTICHGERTPIEVLKLLDESCGGSVTY